MKVRSLILFLVAVSLVFSPIVLAVAPTLDWIVAWEPGDQSNQNNVPYGAILVEPGANRLDVNTRSEVAAPLHYGDAGLNDFDTTIKVLNVDGSAITQESHTCPLRAGNDICLQRGVKWDRADRLTAILMQQHATGSNVGDIGNDPGSLCSWTALFSGPICSANWNISANSDAAYGATRLFADGHTFTWNSSTTQFPIVQTATGTTKLIRAPQSLTGSAIYSETRAGRSIFANDTGPVGWSLIYTGGSFVFRRLDLSDGTQDDTASYADTPSTNPQRVYWLNADEVVTVYAESNALRYRRADAYNLAVSTSTDPAGNQIWQGGADRDTQVHDFDTDRQGGILACGEFTSDTAEQRGWFGHFETDTDTQLWNVTLDLGSQTQVVSCRLDHQGGLFVLVAYIDGGIRKAQVRHYEGGDFEVKDAWDLITIPTATPTATVPSADGALGLKNFCEAIGFTSGPGKFLCGLAIVASGTLLMVVITRDLNKKAVTVIGIISGVGFAILVTILELWPIIALAFMVVLAAAIIAAVMKGVFASGA